MLPKSRVPDDGPLSAKLVLIGEAPGKHEMIHGRPFVGPSGGRLEVWWRLTNRTLLSLGFPLSRGAFYITNVVPYMPDSIDRVPVPEMEDHIQRLHERLAKLEGPVVIVPTGNYALYALTGKGKVSWHKMDGKVVRPGITDWRGSILSYEDLNGRKIKVIPTIHPAAVLRKPKYEQRALKDWQRIALEAMTPDITPVETWQHIEPTIEDVEKFSEDAIQLAHPIGLDIETPKGFVTEFAVVTGTQTVQPKGTTAKGKPRKPRTVEIVEWRSDVKASEEGNVAVYKSGQKKGTLKTRTKRGVSYLGCIGLSNNTSYSITVPLTLKYWGSREKLLRAQGAVQAILNSDVDLVVQNGISYDIPRLIHEGFQVNLANGRRIWDTREMHHAYDPRDDHDLAYMASIYTPFPFWKHEAKDPDEVTKYASNSQALWTYCGLDTVSMLWIFYVLKDLLRREGMLDFFRRHYLNLAPVKVDMTMHGFQVDNERRRVERAKLEEEGKVLAERITKLAGIPLVARKGLSNDRLKFLFYGDKGFEGKTAQDSLERLKLQFPSVKPFGFFPMRKKNTKGSRSVTVDEIALRKLILKYPKIRDLGTALLDYRRNRKKAEFLDAKMLDADHRLRCSYSSCTEAGRFSSSKNPWGTGKNSQNIDRELRYVFVPDDEND